MSTLFYDKLGPRARRRAAWFSAACVALFIALAVLCLGVLRQRGQLDAKLWVVLFQPDLLQLLFRGLLATLAVACTAMILSVASGALIAAGLLSTRPLVRLPLRAWTELFRGMPLLLLIFFIYLGAPSLGLDISPFWALVIGISLYNGAVFAEILRAGVLSLPYGQREAGYAIGLTESETLRLILVPQGIKAMLPAMISQTVVLLKETSYGFIIGYMELLRDGRTAVEFLGEQYSMPVYTGLAVLYISINLILSAIARRLERRSPAGPKAA
jgi:glutamate transport system permease protein